MAKLYGLVWRTATEIQNTEIAVRPGIVGKAFVEEMGTGKIHTEKKVGRSESRLAEDYWLVGGTDRNTLWKLLGIDLDM